MANISSVLKQLDKTWEESEVQESAGFTPLPDGSYTGNIKKISVELSQNGRLQMVTDLVVVEGKYEGKAQKKFDGLDNEISMGYAKGLLQLLGITLSKKLKDLSKEISSFFEEHEDGIDVEFVVKTSGEFTNIFINSLFESVPFGKEDEKPKNKKKGKKPTFDELDDMDKEELIELVEKHKLNIDEPEDIKERKLRKMVVEEMYIEED